jgi:hypothetical protein
MEDWASQISGEEILEEIATTPAALYLPREVCNQLTELCELRGWTPNRLIVEAINSQHDRFEQITLEVMTPLKPGEVEIWPEDPLYLLASVIAHYLMQRLLKSFTDPAGFEEENRQAPAEWSFHSVEELDEDEPDESDW